MKKNPQDTTLRNLRAAKKRETQLARQIVTLERRINRYIDTMNKLLAGLSYRVVTLENKVK